MRKDVKLGLAIGGVLLAVVVVYVLVVSGGDKQPNPVVLTTPDQPSGGDKTTEDKTAPSANSDQSGDPFKSAPAVAAAPTTAPTASDQPKPDDKWSAALNTGKLPMMLTETPAPKTAAPVASAINSNQPTHSTDVDTSTAASLSPTSQPSSDSRTHVIQSGETFSSIAQAVYGSSAYYPHLIRANPTIDARKLRAGMTINIPPLSEVKVDGTQTAAQLATSANIDEKTEYKVQSGDTLSKIALKLFGKRSMADKIYDLNK
ncbi:MAG TPA: LysM peptidoglycan-binding domain-containing protein, partial [Tepidisphaeraceae bacterium]|nr:LysM peptidoglycan-binding domain-containing protein [Tepidisphaeraceae bacterium]